MSETKHVAAPPEGAPEVGADDYPLLRKTCSRYLSAEGMAKVDEAYRFAAEFHRDQRRRSGEPYINHPVEVALILAHDLHMDEDVICAALLHDTVEDTPATLSDLSELFGETVAELVDGVTKLTSIEVDSMDAKQALNLRKMFLAMSRDIRVVIIKLADRLHNMRTLAALPPDRRTFKAHETMDVYAPLADRLGISSLKWELEDLAFFYLEPEEYQRIARMVQDSRDQRERDAEEAIKTLTDELRRVGLDGFTITGRPKHLWSIHLKMKRKGKEFSDIYDLIALRVILQTVGDCYSALGAVHSLWHPLPGRFKDYIATPKPNGYQSLHTTVVGPEARPIEIQLRTVEMHEQAEYGIAAHWLYKRAGNSQGNMSDDDKSSTTRSPGSDAPSSGRSEDDMEDPHEFLEPARGPLRRRDLRLHAQGRGRHPARRLDAARLCVRRPHRGRQPLRRRKGERLRRPAHQPARNRRPRGDPDEEEREPLARLAHHRQDAVGALEDPQLLRGITKADDAEAGRGEVGRELRKRGLGIATPRSAKALARVSEELSFKETDDMLAAIANGKVTAKSVANKVQAVLEEGSPAEMLAAQQRANAEANAAREEFFEGGSKPMSAPRQARAPKGSAKRRRASCGVVAKGDADLLVHLAHCCNPVAGDDIVGFITRGRGVSVHRSSCPNVKGLMAHPERMIEVESDTSGATQFQVEIMVEATDRMGLLKDVTIAVGEAGGNILSAATNTSPQGVAKLRFLVAISDANLLDTLLATVSRVPSVYDARRIMPGEGANSIHGR